MILLSRFISTARPSSPRYTVFPACNSKTPGAESTRFSPSFSQNSPVTVSQPSSALNSASFCRRHWEIAARYALSSAHAEMAIRMATQRSIFSDYSSAIIVPMPATLIRNGTVVTAERTFAADILVDGEKVRDIAPSFPAEAAGRVIDASGMLLLPGGIDAHTHLDMPFGGTTSSDDFETGTRAAAFGGTTTLIDFAIQAKGTKMRDALDTWWKKADGRASIDYGLHMIITDLGEAGLEDMDSMVADGVASFKLFMAYPGVLMVDDATIFQALSRTAKNGALICMHAENGGVIDVIVRRALAEGKTAPIYHALTRPVTAEAEAVNRAIAMAEMAGVPIYIVHLSSYDALQRVAEARDKGLLAYAETCPQYLFLSIEDLDRPDFEGAKYVFTPPLREKWNQDKLWDGLKTNNLQVVSTDHCPFCFKEQKEMGKDDFTKI